MFNYLDVIELVIMTLSMFTGIIRVAFTFTKQNIIDTYIFWMYFSAVITLAAEFVNYFLNQTITSIITWITFQVTIQVSLAFLTSLLFLTFYILQTQSQNFMEEIKQSKRQFLCLSFLPILAGFLNLFVQDSSYSIFQPPRNRFQVIVLFAPITFLLILITIFTVMSLRILKGTEFSPRFDNYQRDLKISLAMKLITFVPFLLIVIAAQFTSSLDTVYLILLCFVNLQILQYNYLFGINPYIQKICMLKISKLKGITLEMDQSDITNTQTATETTNNKLTNRVSGSKVAEIAVSLDLANIRSETQKPKVIGSEKQKVTAVQIKYNSNVT